MGDERNDEPVAAKRKISRAQRNHSARRLAEESPESEAILADLNPQPDDQT